MNEDTIAASTVNPVGRPSKLTTDCVERLADALRSGHTRQTAAALAGISESTLYSWIAAAGRSDATLELLQFSDAILRAEIDAEDTLLGIIRNAAPKSWQAAAWILERRRPENWSRKSKVGLTAPPPAHMSEIEQHLAEAGRAADLQLEIHELSKLGTPFEEWPPHLRAASGWE